MYYDKVLLICHAAKFMILMTCVILILIMIWHYTRCNIITRVICEYISCKLTYHTSYTLADQGSCYIRLAININFAICDYDCMWRGVAMTVTTDYKVTT